MVLGAYAWLSCSEQRTQPPLVPQPDTPTPGQTVYRDLRYASSTSAKHRLDVYLPQATGGPYPVVILIHGGGWRGGDKAQYQADSATADLLRHNFAVVAVNYRFSEEAKFPAQLYDVKAAIRWVRAQAGRLPIDAARVGAWGSSAGAYLAVMAGVTADVPQLEDVGLGHAGLSSRLQAVANWFAPVDFLKLDSMALTQGCPASQIIHNAADSPVSLLMGFPIQANPRAVGVANPLTYLSDDDPPILTAHGLLDCTVPVGQSQLLHQQIRDRLGSSRTKLYLYPNTGHGNRTFTTAGARADVIRFFQQTL